MEKTPKQAAGTQRLMEYWAHGKGAAQIGWGTPGDFERAKALLRKYVPEHMLNGMVANLHHRATGGWPGHAPGIESSMAAAKKAAKKG